MANLPFHSVFQKFFFNMLLLFFPSICEDQQSFSLLKSMKLTQGLQSKSQIEPTVSSPGVGNKPGLELKCWVQSASLQISLVPIQTSQGLLYHGDEIFGILPLHGSTQLQNVIIIIIFGKCRKSFKFRENTPCHPKPAFPPLPNWFAWIQSVLEARAQRDIWPS